MKVNVSMPTTAALQTLFIKKLRAFKTLALLTNDVRVMKWVSEVELSCAMHWARLGYRCERPENEQALSALSVILIAEVEEVVRQAAIGGLKGVGILDAKKLGELVVMEGQELVKRLVYLRTNWTKNKEICRWAEHQWMLSELVD